MALSRSSSDLPADVATMVASLLEALDQAMPGAVEGLYLLGSLALDDYRPGQSDVDFIAVVNPAADLSPLAGVHLALAKAFAQPSCDGIYLTRDELAAMPGGAGPAARDGVVRGDSPDERHPVTWLTLLRHGIVMRGRSPSSDWIAADVAAAIQHSRDNLATYWLPWLNRRRFSQDDPSLSLESDGTVVWGCLGVARLHAAIATGEMVSKSAAGRHALQYFPDHRDIIEEAMRLRRGEESGYAATAERAEALIGFMDEVIAAVP